jgi:hypothetical protein
MVAFNVGGMTVLLAEALTEHNSQTQDCEFDHALLP